MTSRRRRMHPVSDCLFVREFTLIGLHRFTAQGRSIWMLFKLRSISCTKRDSQNAMRAQRILIILPVQMRAPPRTSLALSNDRRVCSFSAYLAGTSLTTPRKRPTTGHMDHHLPKPKSTAESKSCSNQWPVKCASAAAALHVWKRPRPPSRMMVIVLVLDGLVLVRVRLMSDDVTLG